MDFMRLFHIFSVYDEDGDVLLIEVADELPDWLTPETSSTRVFIYQGNLHIIPMGNEGIQPTNIESPLSISQALHILRAQQQETKASEEIQNLLGRKLAPYPKRAFDQLHRTKAIIPKEIARLLYHNPQWIAFAIECFVARDAIDMRVRRRIAVLLFPFFLSFRLFAN
jgi:hypothetical protein